MSVLINGVTQGESNSTIEDLTSQIDGIVSTFTTPSAYESGRLAVYYNSTRMMGGVTELTSTTFSLDFVPSASPQDYLLVDYILD